VRASESKCIVCRRMESIFHTRDRGVSTLLTTLRLVRKFVLVWVSLIFSIFVILTSTPSVFSARIPAIDKYVPTATPARTLVPVRPTTYGLTLSHRDGGAGGGFGGGGGSPFVDLAPLRGGGGSRSSTALPASSKFLAVSSGTSGLDAFASLEADNLLLFLAAAFATDFARSG